MRYLDALGAALAGGEAVLQVRERDGVPIAYLWVAFTDVPSYEIRIAEIDAIAVLPAHQAQGIGTEMVAMAEALARERGAAFLRFSTGVENVAARHLHATADLDVIHVSFEKQLLNPPWPETATEPVQSPKASLRDLTEFFAPEGDG